MTRLSVWLFICFLVGAWIFSYYRYALLPYFNPQIRLVPAQGVFGVIVNPDLNQVTRQWLRPTDRVYFGRSFHFYDPAGFHFRWRAGLHVVAIPYLLPVLLILLRLAWKHRPRHLPPHLCRHCRYNLTGNASGVCPECGARIVASPAPGT